MTVILAFIVSLWKVIASQPKPNNGTQNAKTNKTNKPFARKLITNNRKSSNFVSFFYAVNRVNAERYGSVEVSKD